MPGTVIPPDLEIDLDSVDPSDAGDIKVVSSTESITITNCDTTNNWTVVTGGTGVSVSIETGYYKHEGIGSLVISLSSGTTQAVLKYSATSTMSIHTQGYIKFWGYATLLSALTATLHFGETTYNEQNSTAISISQASMGQKSWTISGISTASRDAVQFFGVTVNSTYTNSKSFYLDYVTAEPGPSQIKAYDGDKVYQIIPKFQAGTYASTGAATKTITLNKKGTPSYIKIQNVTTSDATANDEVTWYSGMTQYYSCRTNGAAAPSTDNIIDVSDGAFTVGNGNYVNENGKTYGYAVWWNDTT